MPPPFLRSRFTNQAGPSIESVLDLADEFEVSKEAMARAYADPHHEAVAFVIIHEGIVRRVSRDQKRFPFITMRRGQPVPQGSIFYGQGLRRLVPSETRSRVPDLWIDVERGRAALSLCEQVCLRARGFAMIMLWYEPAEEEHDQDDERTARQRWRDRRHGAAAQSGTRGRVSGRWRGSIVEQRSQRFDKLCQQAIFSSQRSPPMVTMNVSLPEPMKDWVEGRARDGRFSSASDYVRHLIRRDQEREAAVAALQAEITAGIESGPPRPLDLAAIKARARARHARG